MIDNAECRQAGRPYIFYLLNISFLPVIGFVVQLWLWQRSRSQCRVFANHHARQSILASVGAAVLLGLVSVLILAFGGLSSPYTWVTLILYFTLCHSGLIVLGVVGYARASGGKNFEFLHYSTWWGN